MGMKMSIKMRVVEDPDAWDAYQEGEFDVECNECGISLAVIPPKKIFDLPPHEVNDAGFEWVNDRYFYCKKCQRDLGCDQVDEC